MDSIINNIKNLYITYGNKIDSDKKLMLLYWMKIDGCSVNKEGVSTEDFISKATDPSIILSGVRVYKIMSER